jgi:membrane protein
MTDPSVELEAVRDSPVQVLRTVVARVRDDDVPFMAGSIAYNAFVSLFPLLVLLFVAVTVVGDEQLAGRAVELTEGVFPQSVQELLYDTISDRDGVGSAGASVIGLVTLVWGSLKIFRGLDKAFSEIYRTGEDNGFLDQLRDGLVVLAALGVGVVGMTGAMVAFGAYEGPLPRVVSLVVLVVGLSLAFLPMYRFFPDAELGWVDAVPGALFAAVGWMVLQSLFRLYVQFSSKGDSSGLLGAVLLLLLWLYLAGLVLLLAAEVNAVLLDEDELPAMEDEGDARADLAERFHRERDRRQSLEHECATLERQLRAHRRAAEPDGELMRLRARNRALRRRLQWEERPLLVRALARLLGRAPERVDPTRRPPGVGDVNDP